MSPGDEAAYRAHSRDSLQSPRCTQLCTSLDPGLAAPHPQLCGPSLPESTACPDQPPGGQSPPPREAAPPPCSSAPAEAPRVWALGANTYGAGTRRRLGAVKSRERTRAAAAGRARQSGTRAPPGVRARATLPSSSRPPLPNTREDRLRKPGWRRDALTSELPSQAGRLHRWGLVWSRAARGRSRSGREGGGPAGIRAPGCGPAGGREMGGSTDLSGGGRGGGVPPPETERVGGWNPVEGCAPRH